MAFASGTRFGRYEIRQPLGAGGMGEVYLADDTQLERAVALKLLPAAYTKDEDRLRRFRQEARAISALNHPNILTIYEIGEAHGAHFIATELIVGKTLRQRMTREPIRVLEAVEIALQVAAALEAAHAAGIIHRDIKPENIMLREDGYVKVLDFGLAKLAEPKGAQTGAASIEMAQTEPGMVIGTVLYMSPEQARGLHVDARTDIFSLGVALYEMLTGSIPFGGATPSDVIVSILDRDPAPLNVRLPEASPEIERIIQKMLAKDRDARYASVREMSQDLRRVKQRLEYEEELGRSTEMIAGSPAFMNQTLPYQDKTQLKTGLMNEAVSAGVPTETISATRAESSPTPDIAHVLFMDLVGYSKQMTGVQRQTLQKLNLIVRGTEDFRRALAGNQLISRPAGDGMALAFFGDPEAPVRCALEISRALLNHPEIELRMGIHSGIVIRDVNIAGEKDVTGKGINYAQRVMDCGDAGHILLSKETVEYLCEIGDWAAHLIDLGETEVKHGVPLHLYNLYTGELGNREPPRKISGARKKRSSGKTRKVKQATDAEEGKPTKAGSTLTRKTVKRKSASSESTVSLAVLPLGNASNDASAEYLSDGITESIINTLSPLPQLKVMARATVFRYKGRDVDAQAVGRELSVTYVLVGRVQQLGERLVIKAELVDVREGTQLWGEEYRRKPADIFEVQDEIAREISSNLRIKLSGEDERRLTKRFTENAEAYQLYLKGRYCLSKMTHESIKRGIEFFNQAIEADPNYALAFAGLADAYYALSSAHVPPNEAMPKARAAAERALEIDDTLAEAHASLAVVKAFYEWRWEEAEAAYRRAIELNPGYASAHHWYGWYLALMGRLDQAIPEIKEAYELDPRSLEINTDLGLSFFLARQYDEAVKQFRASIELDQDYILGRFFLGWAYEQKGEVEKAIAEFQRVRQLDDAPFFLAALGHVYAASGRVEEAERVLAELEERAGREHVSAYDFTIIYTALGNRERAFELLEKAFEARSEALVWLKVDPRLDPLRTDPRFIDLQRRVGLPL